MNGNSRMNGMEMRMCGMCMVFRAIFSGNFSAGQPA